MADDSTPLPTLEELRALARAQGVEPTDADLSRRSGLSGDGAARAARARGAHGPRHPLRRACTSPTPSPRDARCARRRDPPWRALAARSGPGCARADRARGRHAQLVPHGPGGRGPRRGGRARPRGGAPCTACRSGSRTSSTSPERGRPQRRGCWPTTSQQPTRPSLQRLRRAGAIVVGKLNTHEFAWGATTTSEAFGPARNPWDTERICGGLERRQRRRRRGRSRSRARSARTRRARCASPPRSAE